MLVDLMLEAARRAPSVVAVSDGTRALTFRALRNLALVVRDTVERRTGSERVGVILPASTAFPAALMGILWARRVAVPFNFLLQPDELAPIVEDADLNLIITVRHFAELAGKLPAKPLFLEDLPLKRAMFFSYFRRIPRAPDVAGDDTAVLLYTSGTTGLAKGVELTQGNLHGNCMGAIASLEIDPRQRFLNILPPFHVFGLTANVLVPLALTAPVHAIPRFSPAAVVRAIPAHDITVILAIPSMYAALLRMKSATPETFRSVRLAISGGEPLPDAVRQAFLERFGVPIRQGYGLTETSPVVSVAMSDEDDPRSVGRPLCNVEVRIVDADGQLSGAGQNGEIQIRGPSVMKSYFRRPEDTRAVLSSDGWFRTGDVGRLDDAGRLYITGRAKEMLIIGGENVFPREIEAALEAQDGVAQVAVIGVPDDLRGEAPVAFVIPKPGAELSEESLRTAARKILAGFKVPKRIEIREDLPIGPTGKILKRKLRELI
ncbi:MAG: AMP-binding protein [Phycisphaerae bacterium]|nr:AMP-binding protein [Phycisphaerae bacterium]